MKSRDICLCILNSLFAFFVLPAGDSYPTNRVLPRFYELKRVPRTLWFRYTGSYRLQCRLAWMSSAFFSFSSKVLAKVDLARVAGRNIAKSLEISLFYRVMANYGQREPARSARFAKALIRRWAGGLAVVMFCAPILLASHGAFAEDNCAGGPAEHALVEVCPVCELCDSIPSAVDIPEPLEMVALPVAGPIGLSLSVSMSSNTASDPASPRAPPVLV